MNILFLTLLDFDNIYERGIYTDLLREFVKGNHKLYIISPTEKKKQISTHLIDGGDYKLLKLQIGNIQKTNIIAKGFATLTLEHKFKRAIKKYFADIKFDLIIYSTPPITLQKAVQYVKKRDDAKTYLLLKDIFPQNAVDLGMLSKKGLKGLLYRYFRKKEKSLYQLSDYIGCMSKSNVEYLLRNNPEIRERTVEVCPNSVEPFGIDIDYKEIQKIRTKYKIPNNKVIFVYGGNLGKPQGIDFLIKCLKENADNEQVYFIVVGAGTEFNKLKKYFDSDKPDNAQLFWELPTNDYELLVNSCDVGLIFLDNRFTIPNFPSRLLSYMQASMPVLAATDVNTDLGQIIEEGKFGFWCESGEIKEFNQLVNKLCNIELIKLMGANAKEYLLNHYTAKQSYEIIIKHFNK